MLLVANWRKPSGETVAHNVENASLYIRRSKKPSGVKDHEDSITVTEDEKGADEPS